MSEKLASEDFKETNLTKVPAVELFTFKSAQRLIKDGHSALVLTHIGNYPEHDRPFIVAEVLSAGNMENVRKSISLIPIEQHQVLAQTALDFGAKNELVAILGSLKDLEKNIALTLLTEGEFSINILVNIDSFKEECRNDIILFLIGQGHEILVRAWLDKLKGLNSEVAKKLLAIGKDKSKENSLRLIALNIGSFGNLEPDVAAELIEGGYGDLVFEKPESFMKLDLIMAKKLIDQKLTHFVALNLNRFSGLDSDTALTLVGEGYADKVMENAELFGLLEQKVAEAIIEKDIVENAGIVLDNAQKFKDLNYNKLAKKIIIAGDEFILVERIHGFSELDSEVALGLIEKGWASSVRSNFNKFKNLTPAVFDSLLRVSRDRSGDIELISEHLESFMFISSTMAEELLQNGDFDALEKNKEKILLFNESKIFEFQEKTKERVGVLRAETFNTAITENLDRFKSVVGGLGNFEKYKRSENKNSLKIEEIFLENDFNSNGVVAVEIRYSYKRYYDSNNGNFDKYHGKVYFLVDALGSKISGQYDDLFELGDGLFKAKKEEGRKYDSIHFLLSKDGNKILSTFYHEQSLCTGVSALEVIEKNSNNNVYIYDVVKWKRIGGPFWNVWLKDGEIQANDGANKSPLGIEIKKDTKSGELFVVQRR